MRTYFGWTHLKSFLDITHWIESNIDKCLQVFCTEFLENIANVVLKYKIFEISLFLIQWMFRDWINLRKRALAKKMVPQAPQSLLQTQITRIRLFIVESVVSNLPKEAISAKNAACGKKVFICPESWSRTTSRRSIFIGHSGRRKTNWEKRKYRIYGNEKEKLYYRQQIH